MEEVLQTKEGGKRLIVNFIIPGPPQGKARAKVYRNHNIVRAVTPEKTVLYENLVKTCYQELNMSQYFNEQALVMVIDAYYDIPKSTSKKKAEDMLNGSIRPTKKPDSDNIAKAIMDALNGVAFKDDSQIVELRIRKHYGKSPKVQVAIGEVEESA